MADIDPATVDRILADAREVKLEAGEWLYGGGRTSHSTDPAMVVEGVVRIAASTAHGRELTIAHLRPGSGVGLTEALLGSPFGLPDPIQAAEVVSIKAEALEDCRLLRVSVESFQRMMSENAAVAWTVARYLAQEKTTSEHLMAKGVFLSVKSRVAAHLLDVAVRERNRLVARTTHQEIASAVGSVREVVSRVLRTMQQGELIRQEDAKVMIMKPAALLDLSLE